MKLPPFDSEDSLFDYKVHPHPQSEAAVDATAVPTATQIVLPLIPPVALFDRGHVEIVLPGDADQFLRFARRELDVSGLNCIHKHLWLAGQERPPRALHHQKLLGRQVACTEEANQHLLWYENRLFVKPLPDFLLSYSVWEKILHRDEQCHENAVGMLLSYVWLVRRKSDLVIAHNEGLLPLEMSWERWTRLSTAILSRADLETFRAVNPRYRYGELRLHRINWIYAFCSQTRSTSTVARGYFNINHDYNSFFARNISWITASTVYVALVLTAMQVGLGTTALKDNITFQNWSYGFTVFSILGPVIIVACMVVGIMGYIFALNLFYTLKLRRTRQNQQEFVWKNEAVRKWKH